MEGNPKDFSLRIGPKKNKKEKEEREGWRVGGSEKERKETKKKFHSDPFVTWRTTSPCCSP